MARELEEKIALGAIKFARGNFMGYSIYYSPPSPEEQETHLNIKLTDQETVNTGRPIFHHCIVFKEDAIIRDGTLSVRTEGRAMSMWDRRNYLDFLEFIKANTGIKLTNSFENFWVSNSNNYPIASRDNPREEQKE